jgi:hypothetical protein
MMRRLPWILTALSVASAAWASIPDVSQCIVESDADGWSMYVTPTGTGTPFTNVYTCTGDRGDATIHLWVIDGNGNPIYQYSWEDMWLEADGVTFCAADPYPPPRPNGGNTDSYGYTYWDGVLYAGGCSTDGVWVVLAGDRLPTPVGLKINSYDMDGDCVNYATETDMYIFYDMMGTGNYCGDFNCDGVVDDLDYAIMTGSSPPTAIDDPQHGTIPTALAIRTVAPNPFNPRTTVWLDLPQAGPVSLIVHDLRWRLVRTLWSGPMDAGRHPVVWDGTDHRGQRAASGIYLVRLMTAEGTQEVAKVTLAK